MIVPYGLSADRAVTLTDSISSRLIGALDLMSDEQADEMTMFPDLIDLWLHRVTGLKLKLDDAGKPEPRVRVRYSEKLSKNVTMWLNATCQPMLTSHLVVFDYFTTVQGEYYDVKVVGEEEEGEIEDPLSYFCMICVKEGGSNPFMFEKKRAHGRFVVNQNDPISVPLFQDYIGRIYMLKNG